MSYYFAKTLKSNFESTLRCTVDGLKKGRF